MHQIEGELEKKIKRAYADDSSARIERARAKKRLGVSGTQALLCALALAALAAVRFALPDSFADLKKAYDALWTSPEALALETAAQEARDALEDVIDRLDA